MMADDAQTLIDAYRDVLAAADALIEAQRQDIEALRELIVTLEKQADTAAWLADTTMETGVYVCQPYATD